MSFASGDFGYVAGALATDPRRVDYPVKGDADAVNTVVYMTVAVNHEDRPTEYVELEARGRTKAYILAQVDHDNEALVRKGVFVMAGGEPQEAHTDKKGKTGKRKIRVTVFSYQTSLDFDVLTGSDNQMK